jgi:signal transduction histidine kinase
MNANNEELLHILRVQSELTMHAELISLLAHDLGHKAIQVSETVEGLIKATNAALGEKKSPESLISVMSETRRACLELEQQIRKLPKAHIISEVDVHFQLASCLSEVVQSLEPVLKRVKMAVDIQVSDTLHCYGIPSVLQQVFLNLLLNSIDAQRSMVRLKPNTIHIHAKVIEAPHRTIAITFWDEGPGISQKHFPNADDIFNLGTTSKQTSAGVGLAITRTLLHRYFGGELSLRNRQCALFELEIPLKEL